MILVPANFFSAMFSMFFHKGILIKGVRKKAQKEENKRRSTAKGAGNDDIFFMVAWVQGVQCFMKHLCKEHGFNETIG